MGFSDYDLSLVCTSKCDDEYLQCVATCSSSECLLDCSRANGACSECKYHFQLSSINLSIQHVHVILIALLVAKDATTPFVSAM